MRSPRVFPRHRRVPVAALLSSLFLLSLAGCTSENGVAGGSSEVDNPQIKVAFVDSAGTAIAFTGSLALFLADQNPALDPDPILEIQLDHDTSAFLSSAQLRKAGATPLFNLLAQGSGGDGALLKGVSYDTATKTLLLSGAAIHKLNVPLVPLVRYTGTVSLAVNGPERVFVPGTPFQTVVVADSFAFENLPEGVFPLRVYSSGGVEREFTGELDTKQKGHFSLDTNTPPIVRPPYPESNFEVYAGADQSVFNQSAIFLSGEVTGVPKNDRRLGILWRQLPPDSTGTWAHIDHPASLTTSIFAWPGVYRFVLTATYGSQKMEDTVTIGVQPEPVVPVFFEPEEGRQLWGGYSYPFSVRWFSGTPDTLDLEFSRDSGATWQILLENSVSKNDFKEYPWVVPGPPAANCFLRLRRQNGSVSAQSARFSIVGTP